MLCHLVANVEKCVFFSKVHRENTPLRAVVSMIGTAENNLGKYLVIIINDAMQTIYMLNSSVSFVNQYDIKPSHVLLNYDVVYLFTNIPLNEAIDFVCDYVYQRHSPP